jgi:hypothetical protein
MFINPCHQIRFGDLVEMKTNAKYFWFGTTTGARYWTDELVYCDDKRTAFAREVGFYLATAQDHFKKDPKATLFMLDKYYTFARDAFFDTPVNDTYAQQFWHTLVELIVNFTQTFRVNNNQPPSKIINEDQLKYCELGIVGIPEATI